ncbi:MAG: hypothetical protein WKG07_30880 [Hymenobacter sp.]
MRCWAYFWVISCTIPTSGRGGFHCHWPAADAGGHLPAARTKSLLVGLGWMSAPWPAWMPWCEPCLLWNRCARPSPCTWAPHRRGAGPRRGPPRRPHGRAGGRSH